MVVVYPCTPDADDVGEHSALHGVEVGSYHRAAPDPDCALCAIGACVQRYVLDPSCSEAVTIHGTYGSA